MAESRIPAASRYQLPDSTYRELVVKKRVMPALKERAVTLLQHYKEQTPQEWREDPEAWVNADEVSRVMAAAEREVTAGEPIVVLAWQVQVTRGAHRLAGISWSDAPGGRGCFSASTDLVHAD